MRSPRLLFRMHGLGGQHDRDTALVVLLLLLRASVALLLAPTRLPDLVVAMLLISTRRTTCVAPMLDQVMHSQLVQLRKMLVERMAHVFPSLNHS